MKAKKTFKNHACVKVFFQRNRNSITVLIHEK